MDVIIRDAESDDQVLRAARIANLFADDYPFGERGAGRKSIVVYTLPDGGAVVACYTFTGNVVVRWDRQPNKHPDDPVDRIRKAVKACVAGIPDRPVGARIRMDFEDGEDMWFIECGYVIGPDGTLDRVSMGVVMLEAALRTYFERHPDAALGAE